MEERNKRRLIILISALALAALAAVIFLVIPALSRKPEATKTLREYTKGEYPDGFSFADAAPAESLSAEALYDAYDDDSDPAHPVLDVKVGLSISSTGSRPGTPRPVQQLPEVPAVPDVSAATPSPTPPPSVTLAPGTAVPGIKPSITVPDISLPELYIVNPKIEGPLFAGDSYTVRWEYSAGREAVFSVSISLDGGKTFSELAGGIAGESSEIILPITAGDACVIRVTAYVGTVAYKTADTESFALLMLPETVTHPIENDIDPRMQYVSSPGVRISSDEKLPVWFKAENSEESAERLVWQLSRIPYLGTRESFEDDAGIIASGAVDMSLGGEFSVDIPTILDELTDSDAGSQGKPVLLTQNGYEFFIRVVALDKDGECIGDPGRGLQFTYGFPAIIADMNSSSFAESSEIEALIQMPYYSKWEWRRVTPDVLNRDISSPPDTVLFSGRDGSQTGSEIIRKAVRVELQVATSPFSNFSSMGFTDPEGLVYSYTDTEPAIGQSSNSYTYITSWDHGIEYDKFVPSKDELDAMGGIYYYVRAVFYVPDSENPSILRPMTSEMLTVAFRVTSAKQNETKQVVVKSNIPLTQFLCYQPVEWQDPAYDEYFEVTRHIEAEEMNFSIKNSDTGEYLLPYATHCKMFGWTREQYQARLDEMLPPGAVIHYIKSEPGFWDEFFSLLESIYTSVQEAYADAKEAAVSIVDYIPLIGDDARAYLKQAARYAIDYGLAYIGLPPNLPNLDRLAAGGLDYCLEYAVSEALQEAGVPPDSPAASEISDQVRQKVSDEIASGLESALIAVQQNPFKASFLRVSTEHLYEPAYIDVLVKNDSATDYSTPGTLYLNFGDGFEVYRGKTMYIPSLKPGESLRIRAYLDHLRNQYDGYGQYFDEIYNGNSEFPFEMRICTNYELKDVKLAAKEQGLSPAPLPYVTEYVYDRQNYSLIRNFVPAEPITEKDAAA